MNSNNVIPHIEPIPEESRLVRRAQAGEADAFMQLYDAYGDDVYRYIYFRVMNDVAAEGITSHVFRYAWEHLESYEKKNSSFVTWIYEIVRNQVIIYYKANVKTRAFNIGFLSVAADYGLNNQAQDFGNVEAWGNHLQLVSADRQQSLLQMTTLQIMRRYLDYLNPGREVKPSPTFNAYTRSWLTRYLQFHPRRPVPSSTPMAWRTSVTYAVLMAVMLITGTARAQAALPGDALYGWKRTSEQAWLSVSPDPVGTDIILANRRLDEYIAVKKDPARSASALDDYVHALSSLNIAGGLETRARIAPMLEAHREQLSDSGLASTQVDNLFAVATEPVAAVVPATQASPTRFVPTATVFSTQVLPTSTLASTQVPPTATLVPTQVPSTATATLVPTEVPPTPTATEVPTEVPPTPTATEVPTEIPPTATDTPIISLDSTLPTDTPQPVPTQLLP